MDTVSMDLIHARDHKNLTNLKNYGSRDLIHARGRCAGGPRAFALPPAPAARPRVGFGAAPAPALWASRGWPRCPRSSGGGRPSGGAPCPAAVAGAVVPPLPLAFRLVVRLPPPCSASCASAPSR